MLLLDGPREDKDLLCIQAEPLLFQSLLFHLPIVYSVKCLVQSFRYLLPQQFCSPAEQTHVPQLFLTGPVLQPSWWPYAELSPLINVFAVWGDTKTGLSTLGRI